MSAVSERLSALAAALRAGGVRVGLGELLAAHRALAAVDASSREEAHAALRAVLCSQHEDLPAFDVAFDAVFGAAGTADRPIPPLAALALPRAPGAAPPRAGAAPREDERLLPEPVPAAWSDVELLRTKDFADYTDAERALAQRLIERIARRGPRRRSRRLRASRRRGRQPDLRRTLRASLRHGGEPLERRWRAPGLRRRQLVLVVDVSGSMAPYARALLQYQQASVAAHGRVEAFAFGTRLTRLTRELAGRDADEALARAAEVVVDWAGGTRIGDALAQLNREHGRRVGRGAVVVIASDGMDRGDPAALALEIARLRRTAHALIWLNPLKAHPGYEPLTRGMVAALPHVDHFVSGHSIASLEALAELLEGNLAAGGSGP